MTGTITIRVLRQLKQAVLVSVSRVPAVGEIVHLANEDPAHFRVVQVAHTPSSNSVHADVWTASVTNQEVNHPWNG